MKNHVQAVRQPPLHLINKFAGLNVLVIGEAMLDSYLDGTTDRLCREAPVPVVTVHDRRNSPGGAGNTALNVQTLGAHARFLSVIGDDAEGEMLRESLYAAGVSTEYLIVHNRRRTVAKHRVLASSHMLVRFDQGSIEPLDEMTEQEVIACLNEVLPECDAVIVSDYGYGILTPNVVQAVADWQVRSPRVLVADSKSLPAYRHANVTAVKPNYTEAAQMLGLARSGRRAQRAEVLMEHGERILDMTGARIAAVTLDTEGAILFERGASPYRTYAHPADHARAAGAGDTFVSALTLALAAGADTPEAAELASAAAAIVVNKEGTSSCQAVELSEYMSAGLKYVRERERLAVKLEAHREQGQRIVFTNGCFDILHSGHITYLNKAKALGDILVVGVNADDSVRRLKGPERPINTLEDRVQVLAGLSSIDYIIPFAEDTPIDVIRAIRPDIFVKGGDYTRDQLPEVPIVEQELGGQVYILPYLENRSTTSIIERIRNEKREEEQAPVEASEGAVQENYLVDLRPMEKGTNGRAKRTRSRGHEDFLQVEQRRKRPMR